MIVNSRVLRFSVPFLFASQFRLHSSYLKPPRPFVASRAPFFQAQLPFKLLVKCVILEVLQSLGSVFGCFFLSCPDTGAEAEGPVRAGHGASFFFNFVSWKISSHVGTCTDRLFGAVFPPLWSEAEAL